MEEDVLLLGRRVVEVLDALLCVLLLIILLPALLQWDGSRLGRATEEEKLAVFSLLTEVSVEETHVVLDGDLAVFERTDFRNTFHVLEVYAIDFGDDQEKWLRFVALSESFDVAVEVVLLEAGEVGPKLIEAAPRLRTSVPTSWPLVSWSTLSYHCYCV